MRAKGTAETGKSETKSDALLDKPVALPFRNLHLFFDRCLLDSIRLEFVR
jgi:hypothetical protein